MYPIGSRSRRVLNQSTHARVANATSVRQSTVATGADVTASAEGRHMYLRHAVSTCALPLYAGDAMHNGTSVPLNLVVAGAGLLQAPPHAASATTSSGAPRRMRCGTT